MTISESGNGVLVASYETECGPWYRGDEARDILVDIRVFDPEAEVTAADVRAFIRDRFGVTR